MMLNRAASSRKALTQCMRVPHRALSRLERVARYAALASGPHKSPAGTEVGPTTSIKDIPLPVYSEVPIRKEDPAKVLDEMPTLVLSPDTSTPHAHPRVTLSDLDKPLPGVEDVTADIAQLAAGPIRNFARLDNGARIVSVDRQGLCSSIGLVVHTGSRYMSPELATLPHMLELMAFRSSDHLNQMQTLKTLEQLGATATCKVGREDVSYQMDVLRQYVPVAVPLLLSNVLCPQFHPEEVAAAHEAVIMQEERMMDGGDNAEALLMDWMHTSAYGGQTLGNPLYATKKDLHLFTPENLQRFVADHCSPERLIIVGVNTDFDELCKWTVRCFAEHQAQASATASGRPHILPAAYTGGDHRVQRDGPLLDVMLGWEVEGGWSSSSLAAVTVLQMFLGGGGSFSTGGPGKGMHTRLYTDILNRHRWVEACQASSVMYGDSGLFTLSATVRPENSGDLIKALARIFKGLSFITPEEVARAKNGLKSSIHMNLEMRSLLMEDIGRQLVLADRVGTAMDFAKMVDAVTAEDMRNVVRHCVRKPSTVVAYGHVAGLPSYSQIDETLRAALP
mmetsp:Transcript_66940/g.160307  ORF Transcript_66940/g.160307 Transcript_66940/m.160307 type:complete len:564 (-) Transcript_66940:48-1739(-)